MTRLGTSPRRGRPACESCVWRRRCPQLRGERNKVRRSRIFDDIWSRRPEGDEVGALGCLYAYYQQRLRPANTVARGGGRHARRYQEPACEAWIRNTGLTGDTGARSRTSPRKMKLSEAAAVGGWRRGKSGGVVSGANGILDPALGRTIDLGGSTLTHDEKMLKSQDQVSR